MTASELVIVEYTYPGLSCHIVSNVGGSGITTANKIKLAIVSAS